MPWHQPLQRCRYWEKSPGCVRRLSVSYQKDFKYHLLLAERMVEGSPVWPTKSHASLPTTPKR
jgi:hypothetical protein